MDQARNPACGATSSTRKAIYATYEPLEPRRLLAGIEAGVLVARGTDRNDLISLALGSGGSVIVSTNSVSQTFDLDDFTGIRLLGLGGNDLLTVSGDISKPITLNGGAGTDRLEAGPTEASVIGGAGYDNWVYAGTATALDMRTVPDVERLDVFSETVADVTGNDLDNGIFIRTRRGVTVRGGAGIDNIHGGPGNDRLEGGDGDDLLQGEGGNDTLVGNAGNDKLDGGSGDDLADGGPGQNSHVDIERFPGGGTSRGRSRVLELSRARAPR